MRLAKNSKEENNQFCKLKISIPHSGSMTGALTLHSGSITGAVRHSGSMTGSFTIDDIVLAQTQIPFKQRTGPDSEFVPGIRSTHSREEKYTIQAANSQE
ncbi:MAG: hypothetical protein ACHQ1H_11980 [Nitrososphaerales archaeon]